jgi:hypothetical protein
MHDGKFRNGYPLVFLNGAEIIATKSSVHLIFFGLEWRRSEIVFPSLTDLMMQLFWLILKVLSPYTASTNGLISLRLFLALARAVNETLFLRHNQNRMG